jgi:hypothetical protein
VQQVSQPEILVAVLSQPDKAMLTILFGQPDVDCGLDVDPVVGRPGSLRDGQFRRLRAEVLGEEPADGRLICPGGRDGPGDQPPR